MSGSFAFKDLQCKALTFKLVSSIISNIWLLGMRLIFIIVSSPFHRWVALNVVCSEYMEHIKRTQKELYSHIRESPTYEQAKTNIGKLAKQFLADVETAQQELKEKRQEAEKERKALEAPTK